MSRLFLRFYLGVIAILFAAWLIQAYVFRRTSLEYNIPVIEAALSGGARLARERLVVAGQENWLSALEKLQSEFDYPLRIVSRAERRLGSELEKRLDGGEIALYRSVVLAALPDGQLLLEMGPLPAFSGPTQTEITIGLGSVFVLSALGIAFLLRPLVSSLRSAERTALAIAQGDLSARIGAGRRKLQLPLTQAFDTMADRVEHLLRSQKELLQSVSHELRTPLARIKFGTELLRSAQDVPQRNRRIDAIDDATDQLNELVGELLTYIRMEAQTDAAEHESCSINDIIEEALENHATLYPHIEFSIDLPSVDKPLSSSRASLLRAIGNLISNAGKYGRSQVKVSACDVNDRLIIIVDDDGPGIPVEQQTAVFEPFKRFSSDSNHPGTGLGLALVRRISHRLRGEVTITASPLGGARFVMSLPRRTS